MHAAQRTEPDWLHCPVGHIVQLLEPAGSNLWASGAEPKKSEEDPQQKKTRCSMAWKDFQAFLGAQGCEIQSYGDEGSCWQLLEAATDGSCTLKASMTLNVNPKDLAVLVFLTLLNSSLTAELKTPEHASWHVKYAFNNQPPTPPPPPRTKNIFHHKRVWLWGVSTYRECLGSSR